MGDKMKIDSASIIIWHGKAFVPRIAAYSSGIRTFIEPVQVVNLDRSALVLAVKNVLETELKLLPDPGREEIKYQFYLLPKLTRARSWKRLCLLGVIYTVEQSEKGFVLEASRLDSKGRWEYDAQRRKIFPANTDLGDVIQALLDDLFVMSYR